MVEDIEFNIMVVCLLFESMGYKVMVVMMGEEVI